MRKQRLMGAALVLLSILVLAWAATGKTQAERDATAVLFTLPAGIYMIVTKNYVLYP